MIKTVSHTKIFQEFYKKNTKNFNLSINPPFVMGSLSLLEKTTIATFLKVYDIQRIFEFGTFLGSTTSILSMNSKIKSKIYSIDLPTKSKFQKFSYKKLSKIIKKYKISNQEQNDKCLQEIYSVFGPLYVQNLKKNYLRKIKLINCDSSQFDFRKFKNYFDLVFIDGGHDIEIVKKDTKNAFFITKKKGIIIWHDVNSKVHKDVSKYLKKLKIEINHINHTYLGYYKKKSDDKVKL